MSVWHWASLALALASAVPAAAAQYVAALTDPNLPAVLVFRVPYAVLEVVGTDRADVEVEMHGMRSGNAETVSIPPVVQGNRVEILHPLNTILLEIRIAVPRRSDLFLHGSNGGVIRVVDVNGSIEIVNSNAGVELVRVAGNASVSTSNGAILAEFIRLDVGATASLVTSNGAIVVTLPEGFEGRVLAESDTGPIESDFAVTLEPAVGLTRPGRVLSGRIGAGGPLLRLRTENAGIKLVRASED